jgi:hypothetical protein
MFKHIFRGDKMVLACTTNGPACASRCDAAARHQALASLDA